MGYRMTYQVWVDWVGAGLGTLSGGIAPLSERGGAQSFMIMNTTGGQFAAGTGTGGSIGSSELQTMATNAGSDISTQLTAATVLARLQAFAGGSG